MLSPNFISRILPEEMWDRFVDIEHEIIMACAGILNDPDLVMLWQVNRFEAEMTLQREIDQIIGRHWNKAARQELKEVFETAARKSLDSGEAIYRLAYKAGHLPLEAGPIAESPALAATLQTGYVAVEKTLTRANLTGGYMARERLREAVAGVGTGDVTIDMAIKTAVNDLAAMGLTGHVYPSGARISLAPYVRREVTTGVMNTTRELSFERAKEWGADLIQISAHAGARPGCFPYQGRIFSVSGNHPDYPALESTSYGEPAGIFGINCRHTFWPWFEGLNDEYTAAQKDPAKSDLDIDNNKLYEQTQEQRRNERQIRAWKQRAAALDEAGVDSSRARGKVKEWQKRQREFLNGKALRRDYTREAA